MTEQPTSIVMTSVNGTLVPTRSISGCFTCQSPHRQFIETQLVNGRSYRSILRTLEGMEVGDKPHPNISSLSVHASKHLALPHHVHREMVERRAKKIGRDIAEESGSLVDYVVINEMVLQRGLERFQAGEIQPDMKDLLAAIVLQHKIEETADGGYDSLAWQQAMYVYMDIAKRFIPPEQFVEYGRALSRDPMLRALVSKQAAASGPDAEVATVTSLPSRKESYDDADA